MKMAVQRGIGSRRLRGYALCILLCIMLLSSCQAEMQDSAFTGQWTCIKVVYDAEEADAALLFSAVSPPVLMLNKDGSATLAMDSDTATGKWMEADGGVLFTDSEKSYQLGFAENMLAMDVGTMVCKFSKSA